MDRLGRRINKLKHQSQTFDIGFKPFWHGFKTNFGRDEIGLIEIHNWFIIGLLKFFKACIVCM